MDRIALPETWHAVSHVVARGNSVFYRLADPRPLRDTEGRYRRDARGRLALEAFLGLPIDGMFDRFEAYRTSLAGDEPDQQRDNEAFRELTSFVETFGPFGFDWSRIHEVVNPEADELAEANWRLTLAAAGFKANAPPPSVGTAVWRVTFPEPGLPFRGYVQNVMTYPDLSWDDRVRLNDPKVPHDVVGPRSSGPLASAVNELAVVVRLADALSREDPFELRDLIRDVPRAPIFDVGERPRQSSLEFDWRSANRGMTPADGWFKPFQMHETHVNWVALGRMILAERLSFRLASTGIGVGLHGTRPTFGWRIGSLLDVIYLQLVDHVRQHPDFGIGTCGVCKAPILRVRKGQRWHSGCAPAGRQRESRAARKQGALGRKRSR